MFEIRILLPLKRCERKVDLISEMIDKKSDLDIEIMGIMSFETRAQLKAIFIYFLFIFIKRQTH